MASGYSITLIVGSGFPGHASVQLDSPTVTTYAGMGPSKGGKPYSGPLNDGVANYDVVSLQKGESPVGRGAYPDNEFSYVDASKYRVRSYTFEISKEQYDAATSAVTSFVPSNPNYNFFGGAICTDYALSILQAAFPRANFSQLSRIPSLLETQLAENSDTGFSPFVATGLMFKPDARPPGFSPSKISTDVSGPSNANFVERTSPFGLGFPANRLESLTSVGAKDLVDSSFPLTVNARPVPYRDQSLQAQQLSKRIPTADLPTFPSGLSGAQPDFEDRYPSIFVNPPVTNDLPPWGGSTNRRSVPDGSVSPVLRALERYRTAQSNSTGHQKASSVFDVGAEARPFMSPDDEARPGGLAGRLVDAMTAARPDQPIDSSGLNQPASESYGGSNERDADRSVRYLMGRIGAAPNSPAYDADASDTAFSAPPAFAPGRPTTSDDRFANWIESGGAIAPLAPHRPVPPAEEGRPRGLFSGRPMDHPLPPWVFGFAETRAPDDQDLLLQLLAPRRGR